MLINEPIYQCTQQYAEQGEPTCQPLSATQTRFEYCPHNPDYDSRAQEYCNLDDKYIL